MSTYSASDSGDASPRGLSARGQRAHGLWLWFWAVVAAGLALLGISLARGAATLLVSGFLPHAHP